MIFDRDLFLLSPDDASAGTSTQEPAQDTQVDNTLDATPEPQVDSTPPQASSWLDSFKSDGLNFQSEDEARKQLTQAYRDAERLRPLAQAASVYQQHAPAFHQWLQSQQKQQQYTQAEQDWTRKLGWNHPEWNPAWQHQITKDDKGNLVPLPGAPADVVMKYQAAQQFRQEFIDQFLTNPAKALEPYVRHIAQESARQYSEQGVGQYKEQQEAHQFIDKHQSWLFDHDAGGAVKQNAIFNPQTGQYENQRALSQWGNVFVQKLQTAANQGLSPEAQQEYALTAVQNAYMASPEYVQWAYEQAQAMAQPQGSARQQANQNFTNRANPAGEPAPRGGNARTSQPTVTRENLEQIMLKRFRDEGVTI